MTKAGSSNSFRRRLLGLKQRLGGDLSRLEREEASDPVGGEASGGLSDVPIPSVGPGQRQLRGRGHAGPARRTETRLLREVTTHAWHASSKGLSAGARTATKKSPGNDWRPCRTPATASGVRGSPGQSQSVNGGLLPWFRSGQERFSFSDSLRAGQLRGDQAMPTLERSRSASSPTAGSMVTSWRRCAGAVRRRQDRTHGRPTSSSNCTSGCNTARRPSSSSSTRPSRTTSWRTAGSTPRRPPGCGDALRRRQDRRRGAQVPARAQGRGQAGRPRVRGDVPGVHEATAGAGPMSGVDGLPLRSGNFPAPAQASGIGCKYSHQ